MAVYTDLLSHNETEFERLTMLAEMLDEGTFRRLAALRPRPGWRCLEIGAGTGTVTRWLARQCPDGELVATDMETDFLQRSTHGVRVIRHDVTTDDFPGGSFDLIFARWVFEHLPNRDEILARVITCLAPGGRILLEDAAAFPLDSSPNPHYRKAVQAILEALRETYGHDSAWARTFPAPLARLGLERLGMEASLPIAYPNSPWIRVMLGTMRRMEATLLESGRLTEDDMVRVHDEVSREEFRDFGLASIAAWGCRPR